MLAPLTLTMDDQPIRFTDDGRMNVLDAVRAIGPEGSEEIFSWLAGRDPEVRDLCQPHTFPGQGECMVADADAWELIFLKILDCLMKKAA